MEITSADHVDGLHSETKSSTCQCYACSTQTLTLWDSNSFTPSLCHRPLQCQVLRQATRSKDLPNESEMVPGSQPDCRAWATVTTNGPPTIFSIMKWRVIIQGSSPIDMSSQTLAACWQFLDALWFKGWVLFGSRVLSIYKVDTCSCNGMNDESAEDELWELFTCHRDEPWPNTRNMSQDRNDKLMSACFIFWILFILWISMYRLLSLLGRVPSHTWTL